MTRRKKFISLFIALIVILSALFVLPFTLTASAVSVTIGSGLFTNTKNMTITGTDDGLTLRVDQKEYAYAEWASTLPMNDFSMDFKINDDNFETLVLTFTSMYDEVVSTDYNLTNPTVEQRKAMIQPEKVKNIITISKPSSGNGINVKINDEGAGLSSIGSDSFLETLFTVSYNEGTFKVETKSAGGSVTGTKSGASIDSNKYDEVAKKYEEAKIINNEANLRIDFPKDSIKKIRKDVKNKDDSSKIDEYGKPTLLITNISYKNINSNETRSQSLKGATVEDASKPVLKVDGRVLNKDNDVSNNKTEVFVPVGTQYKIPVYGMDIIKSSSTLTIRATVNYYELEPNPDYTDDPGNEESEFIPVQKDQILNSSSTLNFQVNKTEGYYLIEKLTISDGTHTITFENKDGSIKNIGDIPMPIYVTAVPRTTEADKSFKFDITEDYAKLFSGIELKGGSKNKIIFPTPLLTGAIGDGGFANFINNNKAGVRSYVGDEKENPYYILYKLWYQNPNDYSDIWTENSAFGLEFTATRTGTYKFRIEAYDRQGNRIIDDTIIELEFIDTEIPEMRVDNFPDEVIVNQKFTIPSASITDDFNTSPTKTVALYYLNKDGSYDESGRIELATDNSFIPDEDMLGKEFIVVYNASEGFVYNPDKNILEEKKAIEVERTFKVVEAPPSVDVGFEWNTLSIVFLSLGGASLLGIIAILMIKPKEKAN